MEEALVKAGITYQLIGGTRFYERREIKDLLAYLRLIYNPADDLSFKRVINVPKRGIGATTVAKLEGAARAAGKSLAEVVMGTPPPGMTAKTWDKVALFGVQLLKWRELAETASVADLLQQVLIDSDYVTWLFAD